MKRSKLWTIFALMAVSTSIHAASFDCKQAATDVEKMICRNYELSNMDSKLARFYGEAKEAVVDPNVLRSAQREWLEERNRCTDVRCLKKRYDRRIDELRVLVAGHKLWDPPPPMTTEAIDRIYVHERRKELINFFNDRPLELSFNSKRERICIDFADDFARQTEKIVLIPPKVVVHDYDDAQLRREIFDYCPDLELRSSKVGPHTPYVGPRNFIVYQANIDNNIENGEDVLFLEEALQMRNPKYGPEIVAQNTFALLDLNDCNGRGFSGTGASRRYPIEYDVSREDPQTGLHGLVRYQGRYYLYGVIDWDPKAPVLSISQHTPGAFGDFKRVCKYYNARN